MTDAPLVVASLEGMGLDWDEAREQWVAFEYDFGRDAWIATEHHPAPWVLLMNEDDRAYARALMAGTTIALDAWARRAPQGRVRDWRIETTRTPRGCDVRVELTERADEDDPRWEDVLQRRWAAACAGDEYNAILRALREWQRLSR